MTKNSKVERRLTPRYNTSLDGILNSSRGARRPVEVVNLSSDGFSADVGAPPISSGGAFSIRFAGLQTLDAELCWTDEARAGFRFERPLHPAVVDHVVQANPTQVLED